MPVTYCRPIQNNNNKKTFSRFQFKYGGNNKKKNQFNNNKIK